MILNKNKDTKKVKFALATLNERFVAFLIDYIIFILIGIACTILWLIFFLPGTIRGLLAVLVFSYILLTFLSIFLVLTWLFIFVWMPYKNSGQSIGKKRKVIKIMIIEDDETMTLRNVTKGDLLRMFYRAIIMFYEASMFFGVIPWYLISHDLNRRIFADIIAHTVVVQFDPEMKLPLKKPRE
ncbi:MAG: RDD family protein [Asgard group archaeon]|nr:RDD family protein [Asgard group archaeon]